MKGVITMKRERPLNKKRFKFIILLLGIIILLSNSEAYASTIDKSNISLSIDNNGTCNIEEMLYITAIDDPSDYSTKYFMSSSSVQLTRGNNIENLSINNSKISNTNIDNYYNDYVGMINLEYSQPRSLSIFIILYKKSKYNFLQRYASIRVRINIWRR